MRIVFMSSTGFGQHILAALKEGGHDVVCVVTRSDKVRKRGGKVDSTPVKKYAIGQGIDVMEADHMDPEITEAICSLAFDLCLVVAFGVLLPESLLHAGRLGNVNIHASLLPYYRGASPIETAIADGASKTGISFMKMDAGMDTGDVYAHFALDDIQGLPFHAVEKRLRNLAISHLPEVLKGIEDGTLIPVPQDRILAPTRKWTKEDARISGRESAQQTLRKIAALDDHVGAFIETSSGRFKVFSASLSPKKCLEGHVQGIDGEILIGCTDGAISVKAIQAAGKKKMSAEDFLRGNHLEGYLLAKSDA